MAPVLTTLGRFCSRWLGLVFELFRTLNKKFSTEEKGVRSEIRTEISARPKTGQDWIGVYVQSEDQTNIMAHSSSIVRE